jgi:outer membrane protein assembly factor BamB
MATNPRHSGGDRSFKMRRMMLGVVMGAVVVGDLAFSPRGQTAEPSLTDAEQTATAPGYWPGWLGANRDGWVGDFQPPERWPESLKQVWQIEVGAGYASPLVADGRVYQHARQGEDEVLWCLDLATGATIWRKSHPVPFQVGGGGERHG